MSTTPESSRRPLIRWFGFLDGALDGLVVAFAAWTVVYQLALATQVSMRWLGWPWLALAGVLAIGFGLREVRGPEPAPAEPPSASPSTRGSRGIHPLLTGVLALVVGVLVALRASWGITPLAVAAVVALGIHLLPWWRQRSRDDAGGDDEPAPVRAWEHLLAAAGSLALGVVAAKLLKPDADDAFYVNRAAWVAEHGTAALGDTMFGPDTLPPAYQGGLPTPSVEALQGVIAHALGLSAATVAYLVCAPLLAVVCGWATWRLVRCWAPRRAGVAFAVTLLFIVASGSSIVGAYSIGRIWQGKVIAFVILMPLVWLYLSRLAARPRRWELFLLAVAGVAFVGLSTTSALLAPVIAGSAIVAALVLRSAPLALGAGCFLAGPLLNAAVQVFGSAAIGDPTAVTATPERAFAIGFGTALPMVLLGFGAVVLAPRLVRGRGAVVALAASLATVACLLPGMLSLADAVTGAGPVIWRLVIVAPTAVLVGLLAVLPVERLVPQAVRDGRVIRTAATAVLPAVALAVIVSSGTWLWSPAAGGSLTARPTWKVPQEPLADVRAVQRLDVPDGLWLLPPKHMEILAISGTTTFAVVPRGHYFPTLDVPEEDWLARQTLFDLAAGRPAPVREVAAALERLDVAVACVRARDRQARERLELAVQADLQHVRRLRCHVRAEGPA